MLGRTHALTGVAAGLLVAHATGTVEGTPLLAYGVAGFSALLPDLDQHQALAARYRLTAPAHVVLRHFRHRRFTHSILGTLIFAVFATLAWAGLDRLGDGIPVNYLYAALAGYVSHIVADLFNKQGVQLFYPFVFSRRLEWIAMPIPRALRISTVTDAKGLPITLGRIQARINTEKVFFKLPVYALIAFLVWHELDGLVVVLRSDVWSAVKSMPEPLSELLTKRCSARYGAWRRPDRSSS